MNSNGPDPIFRPTTFRRPVLFPLLFSALVGVFDSVQCATSEVTARNTTSEALVSALKAHRITPVRKCLSIDECRNSIKNISSKGRVEVTGAVINFRDSKDRIVRSRRLRKVGDVIEHACHVSGGNGAVVTQATVSEGGEGWKSVSHEILDMQGSSKVIISGDQVLEGIAVPPTLDWYLNYRDYYSEIGEPFVFMDATGKVIATHDHIFKSPGEAFGGASHITVGFAPDGSFVVVSVAGAGYAVFSRTGRLAWKVVDPEWVPSVTGHQL